jgi:hypothetical protein
MPYRFVLLWLATSLICLSCNPDKGKKVAQTEKIDYSTSPNSVLFFKNVRQLAYHKEENKAARFDLYRFKDRPTDSTLFLLHPMIVHNWRADAAYIFIEPSLPLSQYDTLHIHWSDSTGTADGSYLYYPGNTDMHYRLSIGLYNSILNKHRLKIGFGDTIADFMTDEAHREAFRKPLQDYLRLINILR